MVENRPSAGGAVGTGQVATANPDGYTLLFAAASMVLLTPQLQKLTYNPMKQLVPITNIGTGTQTIAVQPRPAGDDAAGAHRLRQGQPGQAQFHHRGHAEHQPARTGAAVRQGRHRSRHGPGEERTAGGFGSHVRTD